MMKKTRNTISILIWIYFNISITATETPQHTYFFKGETIILRCLAGAIRVDWIGPALNSSNPSPVSAADVFGKKKIWNTTLYTNGRQINPHLPNFRRLKVVDMYGNGDFDLQISNASIEDEGLYRCDMDEVTGKLLNKVYILQLKKLPSNITIDYETDDNTIIGREDKLLKIACNVESGSPPETIYWKQNGTILKEGGPKRNVYEFCTNRFEHNSWLTCEVINVFSIEPLRKTVRLDIQYKPRVFIHHVETNPVLEGTKTKLCCEIDSNPNISFIRWSKDSKDVTNKMHSSCLLFNRVDRLDSGNYTCVVGNEIGNGSFETSLVVFYPPGVHLEYTNFTINDELRAIQCEANGLPATYTYGVWEHRSEFNEHIRFFSTYNGTLILPRINAASDRYQDSGSYICSVTNGVPNSQHFQHGKAYIAYKGPPVFVNHNSEIQYGSEGKSMTLIANILSYSKINCKEIHALYGKPGDNYDHDSYAKPLKIKDMFHGKHISVRGIQVRFVFEKLDQYHFQMYKITVCNEYGYQSYVVNLVKRANYSSEERAITSECIVIVVLAVIIVFLLTVVVIYFRNLKQRYRKRMMSTTNGQASERNSDASAHYIDILDENIALPTLEEYQNQIISTDAGMIVDNRDMLSEEQQFEFSNNNSDNLEHTIASSDNDSGASEHIDDGYERPYTTLVANIGAEDEHIYKNTNSEATCTKDNTLTSQNATYRPSFAFTEQVS